MRILLTEDDPQLGRATQIGLEQAGYAVDWVQSAEHAHTAVRLHDYGCILLDLGLPGQDGMQALHALRKAGYGGAILIVTARDKIPERIAGLDGGADDFIVKPFDLDELAARIRSASRRAAGRLREELVHGDLVLDVAARQVSHAGKPVALTSREFGVLLTLVENSGRVLSREQLEHQLYSWGEEVESNAVQVHIHHLRKKLGRTLIRTVHAVGYCIDKPAPEAGA
ncbi:DNA-binding response regulator [Duganella sp. BJB488]|uniref:response regulator n=1 Tax=unclassified Duganella TaxID=2636909 RepID=UPI000E353746|nr:MULTISPECIES: response regulator transcription factor [unclassified Duganella]RFP24296.1 DNA-binding response regulator [Duganella sp. BJB489]RFP26657.1 DNA-binding response regulator [Duganella sp. BJB488]RFP34611.1 DNA-binding response regulator [Duganella sp. BJB480]